MIKTSPPRVPVVHVIGGGTVNQVRPHMSLVAEAYGETARAVANLAQYAWRDVEVRLHLTKMATGGSNRDLNTVDDMERLLKSIVADPATKVIFMSAAVMDFNGHILDGSVPTESGLTAPRLRTRGTGPCLMELTPSKKLLQEVRKYRKDIFLVGFKTTSNETEDEQFRQGLTLLKESSANIVLANDIRTRTNMIIVPERSRYCVTKDRGQVLEQLVDMAQKRSRLTFTRSTVVDGAPVSWHSDQVPHALRAVVNHCVKRGAYKPFLGRTEGHFAVKIGEGKFLSSIRKTDINKVHETGMVLVESSGNDSVVAHGARPSVGGQSQRIVFAQHPGVQCIVHFHCPMRAGSTVPVRSQREFECGSHECGRNTSNGMREFRLPNGQSLQAVMLDQHGPNVAFSVDTDPSEVIRFIEENFMLEAITDGSTETKQKPFVPEVGILHP